MKLTLYGIHGIPLGKRNIKDSRLDEANRLVEADKKTYAQADLIGDDQLGDADAILTTRESFPDLILKDLEFVETRLGRNPPEVERAALLKVSAALEAERCASASGLGAEEWQAVGPHNFCTNQPVIVAAAEELQEPDALFVRAFKEAGYICFLTVGGKEQPPGRRRAPFTRTSRKDSSARKSSVTRISSRPAAKRRPSGRASCVWRQRITWCATSTS